MALEGAWLITNRKLDEDKPHVNLHTESGEPYVCVNLGASGNYIRIHTAPAARDLFEAFFEALRLLDPDGAPDALVGLIEGDALAVIRRRVAEAEAKCERAHLVPVDEAEDDWSPAPQCAKCHAEPRAPGGPYGAKCLDMCLEALEFDHCCMICATPEERKALGYPAPPQDYDAPLEGCVRCGATDKPLRPLATEPGQVCNERARCDERREKAAKGQRVPVAGDLL